MTQAASPQRRDVEEFLASIAAFADEREDVTLLMASTALARVYGLFPGADEPRQRGTVENAVHVAIHNTLVEVFDAYLLCLAAEADGLAAASSPAQDKHLGN